MHTQPIQLSVVNKKLFYSDKEFYISFLEKDGVGDTIQHCSIYYNLDKDEWWSENCIDYPYKKFKSYNEVKQHLLDIKEDIINNGFNSVNLC